MNIANLLKYCPKGTKLYSTAFGEVELIDTSSLANTILVQNNHDTPFTFYRDGSYILDGECILFPSNDQRDWSKFRLPVKRGDIMMIPNTNHAFIATGAFTDNGSIMFVCGIDADNELFINSSNVGWTSDFYIPASEEAKKELFDKMAEAGYKWNTNTLELEKIEPKFKEGDFIKNKQGTIYLVSEVIDYDVINLKAALAVTSELVIGLGTIQSFDDLSMATEEEKNKLLSALIRAGYKYDQEQHKLVKQEFKPFDKVLVRNDTNDVWLCSLFSQYFIHQAPFNYCCVNGKSYRFCIPYEGNEYLLGTTDSPT